MLLSWAVQRGTAAIPKTVHEDRLIENLDLFRLSDESFREVNELYRKVGTIRYLDPSAHVGFDVFNELHDEPVMDCAPWDL